MGYYSAYERDNNQHMRKGKSHAWKWILLWFVLIMLFA